MPFQSINPATEEMLGEFDELQPDGIERALAAGRRAFESWHRATFDERSQLLRSVAKQLRKDKPVKRLKAVGCRSNRWSGAHRLSARTNPDNVLPVSMAKPPRPLFSPSDKYPSRYDRES